jgi:cobalt-precorrin-5B (C1)-methyltransferase
MKRKLRTGFTTGTAAAAAAKGALSCILEGKRPSKVVIKLLTGDKITIPISRCETKAQNEAACTVIKDAGDDPDVTHKAEIGALVKLLKLRPAKGDTIEDQNGVYISGGVGVGRITKPGLELPPGEAAINPGPRKMITEAINEVLDDHRIQQSVNVEVFVPQGEEIAKKTLNARLGILGGISILGTTGIVRPMSHEAFIATIESALSVARATGHKKVILTTGRRSERFAQNLWPQLSEEAFVQIGDFFKLSLQIASEKAFKHVALAVFFGKAIKMAQGVPHTHAAKSRLTLNTLSKWAQAITKDDQFSRSILSANTARHAFETIRKHYPEVISYVGRQIIKSATSFSGEQVSIQSVIFNYEGEVVFDSQNIKKFGPQTTQKLLSRD